MKITIGHIVGSFFLGLLPFNNINSALYTPDYAGIREYYKNATNVISNQMIDTALERAKGAK